MQCDKVKECDNKIEPPKNSKKNIQIKKKVGMGRSCEVYLCKF